MNPALWLAASAIPAAKAGAPDQRCGARRRLNADAIAPMRTP